MQKNNKKIYKVALAVTAEKYLKVSAENSEDAIKEAARIFRDELVVQLDKSDVDYVFISVSERLTDKSFTGKFRICRCNRLRSTKLFTVICSCYRIRNLFCCVL